MRLRVHFQKLVALFRLGFPAATVQTDLNLATENDSPAHFTKGIPSPSTLSRTLPAPIDCRHTGSGLFHSPPGVLFTFPSRYCFAIGRHQYLALDHGRPGFNRNSTCSGLLGFYIQEVVHFSPTGLSPSSVRFPNTVRLNAPFLTPREVCGLLRYRPATPEQQRPQSWHCPGLGSSPFAHHYLGNLFDFFSSGY